MEQNLQIGLIVDCLKLGVERGIRKAAEMGVRGVQLYAVSGEMAPDNLTKANRSELLKRIQSCGMVVSAVCGDLGGHGFARADGNAARLEASRKIMELAKDLEADVVTTHIGVIPGEENERYETLYDACRKLGAIGLEQGGVFAVETGPEPAATLRRFLEDVDSKGVGVNYDPANLAMVTGDDPVRGVYELKDYIIHTHAKDGIMVQKGDPEAIYNAFAEPGSDWMNFSDYFRETPLGEGSVDFPAYLAALRDVGYKGFLTIEREVGEFPERDIRLAVGFLQKLL